ncbi:RNA polymerase sigma factor SigF [bacterium HR17]|uniref:RNA polymerase sigma factor SigF n=1 Tax=Candidatus Fervidibacter japonicus TaxID=2035412 RepID=A0A2H5XBE2_9BACT|nr:RNA polymerase sigma factor SigF [bacterium HR17]
MTEREKFQLYRQTRDERLREELINTYRPLAEHIARQFAYTGEPLEDLIQWALIGLIKAVDAYDPSVGVKFTTYAWHHIRGEVSHYLRDQGKLIAEPAWLQEARIKVERARNELRQHLYREPTAEELAHATGLKPEVVQRVLETEHTFRVTSLEETVDDDADDEGTVELERLAVDESAVEAEQHYLLHSAVSKLPELQRKVIELLFWEDLSLSEIARTLGYSVTYISYLQRQALNALRRMFGVTVPETPQRARKPRRTTKQDAAPDELQRTHGKRLRKGGAPKDAE